MRWISTLVVLLLLAGGGWYWYAHAQSNASAPAAARAPKGGRSQAPAILVSATTVSTRDVPLYLDGLGTVQAFKSVTVRTQVDGVLNKVLFKEGQDVKTDDVIAEIDPRLLQAQLEQAIARKNQDEAKVTQDLAKVTADAAKVKQDEAKKGQDIAKKAADVTNRNNAQVKADRLQDMVKAGAGTQQEADDQRAIARQLDDVIKGDDAAILADDATIATDQALLKSDEATVEADRATVEADKAAIRYQETLLSYTTIRSPIDGKTGVRLIDAGNVVRTSDQNGLVVITQLRPISVLFTLPQQDLVRINRAMRDGILAVIAVEDDNKTEIERGSLDLVDNQIDQTTGTIKLKATFPNQRQRLWPGGFVNIRLLVETRRTSLVLAQQAVQQGPDKPYVYVIKPGALPPVERAPKTDGKPAEKSVPAKLAGEGEKERKARPEFEVELRTVDVALFQDGEAIVKSGLRDGEKVVITGQDRLKNGARVSVIEPREPKGAKAPGEVSTDAQPGHSEPVERPRSPNGTPRTEATAGVGETK